MAKTNDSWIPEGYSAPVERSTYMKFEDGENVIRIMSPLVTGFEYWTEGGKPVRFKEEPKDTPDIRKDDEGNPTKVKFFWYFLVYNYAAKQVQALEVTQKSIQAGIQDLVNNDKWGNPNGFDITINKSGKGLETRYSIVPNPHSEITEDMQSELDSIDIDLEAIFA